MRPDQIARLQDLAEKLAEVVLEEADPQNWPAAGIAADAMTQQERGDRYWCKRNAAATFGLLERTMRTVADAAEVNPRSGEPNDRPELHKEVSRLEREAGKLLEKVMGKAAAVSRGKP
jgi:hypothetical protein